MGNLSPQPCTRPFWAPWPRVRHTVFCKTQCTGLPMSRLHIRWKVCKYAQQNSLLFIPTSIPLPQPSSHNFILSIACKTSFNGRSSYVHNRWKKLKAIYLYRNFHKHKLGWRCHHTAPTLKIWQYKNATLLLSCTTCPTPSPLYILHYKSFPKFGGMYVCWMVKVHGAWQLAHFSWDCSVPTIAVLHKVKRSKIKLMIKSKKWARSYIKP